MEQITEFCDLLSQKCGIEWDRGVHDRDQYMLYGWIEREEVAVVKDGGGRVVDEMVLPSLSRDFVVLMFGLVPSDKSEDTAWLGWVTSSSEHSEKIHTLGKESPFITYGSDEHDDAACQPIRDLFPVQSVVPWQQ